MQGKELPKILTVSINAWRDNTGINTLTNILSAWDPERVSQIYARTAEPDTKVCRHFFRISESDVLKSVFKRNLKTGREVFNSPERTEDKKETDLYAKKRGSAFFEWAREFVWLLGRWKTPELKKFIDDFAPDVIFAPIYPTVYMGRIQRFIIKYTEKPVVSYIADDNYTYKACRRLLPAFLHRFWLRKYIHFIVKRSDKVFVIAPKQKEEYDRLFGISSDILTKGKDFSKLSFIEKPVSEPLKMVYTGKLILGRWKTLALIANALGEINSNGIKIELDIYTTDTLNEEQKKALNRNGCSVKGALALDEVLEVQNNADILVFCESLDMSYCRSARLSFSTKIVDYLASGKCIFAVGSAELAPMDYFMRYDSAITAVNENEIKQQLYRLAEDKELICEYGKKAFQCGKERHDIGTMHRLFCDAVCKAAK